MQRAVKSVASWTAFRNSIQGLHGLCYTNSLTLSRPVRLGCALRIAHRGGSLHAMASHGILPSSPARRLHQEVIVTLSSSPDLPSLHDLLGNPLKQPPLRSGKHAAPIPETATQTFASVGSLLRCGQLTESDQHDVPNEQAKPEKKRTQEKGGPKRTALKAVVEISPDASSDLGPTDVGTYTPEPDVMKKPKQQSTASGCDLRAETELLSPSKDQPRRKVKAVKEAGNRQQLATASENVVKGPGKEMVSRKKTGTTSKHFQSTDSALPEPVLGRRSPDPVGLEPAMPRRTDWTPPAANTVITLSDSSAIKELSSPALRKHPGADVFKTLCDTFACKPDQSTKATNVESKPEQDVLKKRKLIELVTTSKGSTASRDPSPTKSLVKSKAPKKKPRTLTEVATAAYAVPPADGIDGSESTNKANSLSLNNCTEHGEEGQEHAGEKPRRKATKKQVMRKAQPRRQLLLSPTSAMRQSTGQDFVFGTSSQLATERSPSLLRDLQLAMQASNRVEDDPFASSSPPNQSPTRRHAQSRLWAAGARDAEGDLLSLEVIDLVDSPTFPKDYLTNPVRLVEESERALRRAELATATGEPTSVRIAAGNPAVQTAMPTTTVDKPPVATINVPSSPGEMITHEPLAARGAGPSRVTNTEMAHRDRDTPDDDPPPSNQEQQVLSQSKPSENHEGIPRPKYELFTDAQLAKEIRSYGFKAVKKRAAMIALLDQCWTSKTGQSVTSRPTARATISTTSAASLPRAKQTATPVKEPASTLVRPRGRPRKDSKTPAALSTVAASEETISPPKRGRGRPRKDATVSTKTTSATVGKVTAVSATAAAPAPAPGASTPEQRKATRVRVVEIADSDSEELLTSPEQVFSSPPGVDLSMHEDTKMPLNMSPTDEQSVIFHFITKAVTSAPRSKNPLDPSWHEKMLMYDPIVLEDLTAWLNSGQLDRVGHDAEVSPIDVKKWCESKSICCLWRINLNGQERKRF